MLSTVEEWGCVCERILEEITGLSGYWCSGVAVGEEDRFGYEVSTALRGGNMIPVFDIWVIVQILTPVNQVTNLLIQFLILQIKLLLIEFFNHFVFFLFHSFRQLLSLILFLSFFQILNEFHLLLLTITLLVEVFQPFQFCLLKVISYVLLVAASCNTFRYEATSCDGRNAPSSLSTVTRSLF